MGGLAGAGPAAGWAGAGLVAGVGSWLASLMMAVTAWGVLSVMVAQMVTCSSVTGSLAGACVLTPPAQAGGALRRWWSGARASAQRLPAGVRVRRRWHGSSGEAGAGALGFAADGWQGCYPDRVVWMDAFRMAVRWYMAIRFRSQAWSSHMWPLAVQSGHGALTRARR